MSREIKFRVWDKENQSMEQVGAIDWDYSATTPVSCNTLTTKLYFGYHESLNPVLMQYTGLKDRHGKEIYEGDIFRARDWVAVVEWEDEGRVLGFMRGVGGERKILYINREPLVEVIGNIYENPELVKMT